MSTQIAQPKSVQNLLKVPYHLADFIDPDDYRKLGNAIIRLSCKWTPDRLVRLETLHGKIGEWLTIEVLRLLHTEAPLGLDAFRIYLSDGLVGYDDQFSNEQVLRIRSLITMLAELGGDVSITP
jgi:hypothetical protein